MYLSSVQYLHKFDGGNIHQTDYGHKLNDSIISANEAVKYPIPIFLSTRAGNLANPSCGTVSTARSANGSGFERYFLVIYQRANRRAARCPPTATDTEFASGRQFSVCPPLNVKAIKSERRLSVEATHSLTVNNDD
jgi:hypothetical protein